MSEGVNVIAVDLIAINTWMGSVLSRNGHLHRQTMVPALRKPSSGCYTMLFPCV